MMDARTGVGFVQTCQRIYAHEGLLGFYAGLPVTLLRVIPKPLPPMNCCCNGQKRKYKSLGAGHNVITIGII